MPLPSGAAVTAQKGPVLQYHIHKDNQVRGVACRVNAGNTAAPACLPACLRARGGAKILGVSTDGIGIGGSRFLRETK